MVRKTLIVSPGPRTPYLFRETSRPCLSDLCYRRRRLPFDSLDDVCSHMEEEEEEEEPTSVDWRWAPNPKPPLMVAHYSLDLLKRYLKSEKRLPKLKGNGRPKVEAEMLAGKEKLLARETIFVDELWQVQAIVGLLKANDWKGAFVVDENLDVYERNVIINNANSRQLTAYVAPPHYKE